MTLSLSNNLWEIGNFVTWSLLFHKYIDIENSTYLSFLCLLLMFYNLPCTSLIYLLFDLFLGAFVDDIVAIINDIFFPFFSWLLLYRNTITRELLSNANLMNINLCLKFFYGFFILCRTGFTHLSTMILAVIFHG